MEDKKDLTKTEELESQEPAEESTKRLADSQLENVNGGGVNSGTQSSDFFKRVVR